MSSSPALPSGGRKSGSPIEAPPGVETDELLQASEANGKDEIRPVKTGEALARDHTVIRVPHRKRKNLTRKRTKRFLDNQCRKMLNKEFWLARLPLVGWARSYDLDSLFGDVIAGLTTALTVIPQGIGYAPLAGLPLQYGLYASIFPGFVYAVFGTCKEATVGPTAVNALMSYNYAGSSVTKAVTLAFFTGIIEILAGMLNLGFLINFISAPVISAFTSAVSIQVATSQVKGLLGLKVPGRGFLKTWIGVFKNMHLVRPCDAAVGFSCIGILLFLRKLKDIHCCEGTDLETTRAKVIGKVKWLISISRNCLVVILSTIIAYYVVEVAGMGNVLILTGDVEAGIPEFQLPWRFNLNETVVTNSTSLPGPIEIAEDLGIGLLMLPLVSLLQHLAIAKFYAPTTRRVDASQEMIALGSCQLLGSFVGSMPVTASFGRSAVNGASGVRTPFGGILTGVIILMACAFLTPHFAYIPTSALSAVIISAMIFTIDIDILLPIWRSKKSDLLPYCLTFFLGLFVSVEVGMIVGTLTHLAMLIFSASSPKVTMSQEKIDNIPYHLVIPDRALYFPSVEEIRTRLREVAAKGQGHPEGQGHPGDLIPVIVDMSQVVEIDYSAAAGIRALAKQLKKSGQNIYFCNVKADIEDVLQGVDPSLFLAYVNVQDAEQKIRGS